MDFNETKRQHALAWKNVPKEKVSKKNWSLLWWIPTGGAFFLKLLDYPWLACMGVAVFCALNASREATIKNLKLLPSLLKGLVKNGA